MPSGGRTDVVSKLLGVYITDDATVTGNPAAFSVDNVTRPREQGQTVVARDFSPTNRTFLTRPGFKVQIEHCTLALFYALKTAFALNSTRETIVYHRFGTFDGDAKPDRSAGGLLASNFNHNFAGAQALDVVCAVAPTDGDWVAPT